MQDKGQNIAPIKDRILKFINLKGIKKVDFFKKTNISASLFKSDGLKSELGGDKIAIILSLYPDLNSNWLLTGNGNMILTVQSDRPVDRPVDRPINENVHLNDETGATTEVFPADGGNGCKNCKKLEGQVFFLQNTIKAKNLAIAEKEDKIDSLNRQIGRLELENEQLKGKSSTSNKQTDLAS